MIRASVAASTVAGDASGCDVEATRFLSFEPRSHDSEDERNLFDRVKDMFG